MSNGTVKWFNLAKGYGFIQPEEGKNDVFVHVSELERAGINKLVEGQKVNFKLASKNGKTSAVDIQLAE